MPENLARTWITGAPVAPTLTWVGRSAIAWIAPIANSAQPTTTTPIGSSRTRDRPVTGATRGRSETLVTRCSGCGRHQHRVLDQVAREHRAARSFGNQRLLAGRVGAPNGVHARA